jgi:N6-adenosine-specific RNA methylase IME4
VETKRMQEMTFHPVADLFPLLQESEMFALVEDIRDNGLREEIWTYQGRILDGRNRYLACLRAGVTPIYREWDGEGSLVAFVWSLNGARRHLNSGQKAAIAVEMLPLLKAEAAARRAAVIAKQERDEAGRVKPLSQKIDSADANENRAAAKAAKVTGTNRQYVDDADKLKAEAPAVFEQVKTGKKSLIEAKHELKEQAREAKAKREANRRKVAQAPTLDDLAASGSKFATIVIDPSWDCGDEGDVNQMGRGRPDYATMPMRKLLDLPVVEVADEDCHLYLCITNWSLPKGFVLIEEWGFHYVTTLTWVKPTYGRGNYFRGQTEHVLFGVRGSQPLKRRDVGTVFHTPHGRLHGQKPDEFYELVESCSPGPYLEMFSPSGRKDWATWGESGAIATCQGFGLEYERNTRVQQHQTD